MWLSVEEPKPSYKSTPPSSRADTIVKDPAFLESVDNRIYFYSEIGRAEVLQLNKTLRNLNSSHMADQKRFARKEPDEIFLHINSYGGSIFAGLSVVDEIRRSQVPITTVVDGCCASAATLVSVVGHRRLINKHAFMLVHQLSSVMWGKYSEFKDNMENLNHEMEIIKNIYHQYTKMPDKQIDEILKHDLWWDAKTCIRYGLADEII